MLFLNVYILFPSTIVSGIFVGFFVIFVLPQSILFAVTAFIYCY